MTNNSVDITGDILKHTALMDLALEFASSREYLKDLKIRKKEMLIGTVMPVVELICAAGAYPTYPMRMLPFGNSMLLKSIDLGKSLMGSSLLSKTLNFLGKASFIKPVVKDVVNEVVDGIFKQYGRMYDYGVDCGVPGDECYGIKVVVGAYNEKGNNLDASLFTSVRCSAWQKMYESCTMNTPCIFLDVPPSKSLNARELAIEEVNYAVEKLEHITGNSITNHDLRRVVESTNRCKDLSQELIDLAMGDYYSIHPVSFSKILGLIEIFFQDYLSDPKRMEKILQNLVSEMKRAIKKRESVYYVREMPKILFTPRFGGWDYAIGDYLYEQGARVVYADWHLYGFMDRISTTGDMFENYADYLIANSNGFGPNNSALIDRIANFTVDNEFEGVIYNQLFGCHSLTTGYTRLRRELLKEEIPSTMVSFNNVGENREQLKTRCEALIEIVKA